MIDPTAQVSGATRNPKAVRQCRRRASPQLLDRSFQPGCYAFVGIDPHNPIPGCHRVREFVFVLVSGKLTIEDAISETSRNFDCTISRVRIDDDDLIRPGHRLADCRDVVLLVVDVDLDGNLHGGGRWPLVGRFWILDFGFWITRGIQ